MNPIDYTSFVKWEYVKCFCYIESEMTMSRTEKKMDKQDEVFNYQGKSWCYQEVTKNDLQIKFFNVIIQEILLD